MSDYPEEFGNPIRHAFVILGIVAVHSLAIGALWSGLKPSTMRTVATIFQIDVVPAVKPQDRPPRPSPDHLTESFQSRFRRSISLSSKQLQCRFKSGDWARNTATLPDPPAAPAPPTVPNVRPRPIHVPGAWGRYPPESIRAGESGAPTITICNSATGAVDSVQVSQSSGYPRLDQAAVGIGREALFRPARLRNSAPKID